MKTILIALFLLCAVETAQSKNIVWKIGEADNSSKEFALAPDRYLQFVASDFGWEDKYYVIGVSTPGTNWPYIMPGPGDSWGGTSANSGKRTQVLNILFNIESNITNSTAFNVIVDLQNGSSDAGFIELNINGNYFFNQLPKGNNDVSKIGQNGDDGVERLWNLEVPENMIKQGTNIISIRTIAGGWITFDQVRLESCDIVRIAPPNNTFVKNVAFADYEQTANGSKIQPLLINILQQISNALFEVKIDNHLMFSKNIDPREYNFEIPVPSVTTNKTTAYSILIDGKEIKSGTLNQTHQSKEFMLADYVDTRIGSAHSRWMYAPGPWMPSSMVKFSPDNQNRGDQSGYDPSINTISGFSHLHEYTMEGLLVMPSNGDMQTSAGGEYDVSNSYRARFDKTSEQAGLGLYSVNFNERHIRAEITQTNRCSFGRYMFYGSEPKSRIIIDTRTQGEKYAQNKAVIFEKINDYTIRGKCRYYIGRVWTSGWYYDNIGVAYNHDINNAEQDYTIYFYIQFDKPISKVEYYINGNVLNQALYEGHYDGGDEFSKSLINVEFNTTPTNQAVKMRTGISLVDTTNARLNLETEISNPFGWDFDRVVQFNKDTWNDYFGRVVIQTPDKLEKIRFYNSCYQHLNATMDL